MKNIHLVLFASLIAFINSYSLHSATISAGSNNNLLLDHNGQVWAFGANEYGQLGLGHNENVAMPNKILALENIKIKAISISDFHTVLLDEYGIVWTCGYGNYGQLGHGTQDNHFIPMKIESLQQIEIVAISAGANYTVLLDAQGHVWTFGNGSYGQLGHGNEENQFIPVQVAGLEQIEVKAISAGDYHAMLLDSEGHVWSWGYNGWGQLGHGDDKNKNIPKKIEDLPVEIVSIVLGFGHTALLDLDGHVWTCGIGSDGQLGHENIYDQITPKKIEILQNRNIVSICANSHQTTLLDDNGCIWRFGSIFSAETGKLIYQIVPIKIDPLPTEILSLSAGYQHMVLLDAQGDVWTFGNGSYEHLGHGNSNNQSVPTKIIGIPKISLGKKLITSAAMML